MSTQTALAEEIIAELTAIQGKPVSALVDKGEIPIPSMLPAGGEKGIYTNKKIERAITALGRLLRTEDPSLATRFRDSEWNSAVRNSIGPSLARIDLDHALADNAKAVLADMKAALATATAVSTVREHVLPCTLFNADISPFNIGPLTIETRSAWLQRQRASGALPPKVADRMARAFAGEKLRQRKSSLEATQEKTLLQMIDGCPFVCSVKTSDFAPDASHEKALMVARLGLTMTALLWRTPSKALDGMNLRFDRQVRSLKTLSFTDKIGIPGFKLSNMPHGPFFKPGEWEKLFKHRTAHFVQCGEVLDFVASADGKVQRPNVMSALAQALLWFHEGCRETVDLMAVVNFAAALDALASGKKSQGIRTLITARLGWSDSTPLYPDGPTMKNAIDTIYSEGRSRAIHGTSDKIGHDWSVTRGLAEFLARACILACLDWAATNPTNDDPNAMRR